MRFDRIENAWAGGGHTAILIRPHDPLADSLRTAVALEDQGKYADAAASYRQILAAHPDSFVAWTNLGNAERQLKQTREAEEAYRKALDLDPDSRDALNNLSWLLYEEKRLPEAESLARKAIAAARPRFVHDSRHSGADPRCPRSVCRIRGGISRGHRRSPGLAAGGPARVGERAGGNAELVQIVTRNCRFRSCAPLPSPYQRMYVVAS